MANSWMRLDYQASSYGLPEEVVARDSFNARDCGWVEQMRPIIREFTKVGDCVLDPYCGFGSTLVAAGLEGRESIGFEIEEGRQLLAHERLMTLGMQGQVMLGDSEILAGNVAQVDLILTSLPYFGCGYGSNHEGQLYQISTYESYLEKIRATLKALKRALKSGGYLVVAVENTRLGGQFVPLAWDVARLMMARYAFIEDRIIVYDKPHDMSVSPLSNRAHEYVLVARNAPAVCDTQASLRLLKSLQVNFPEALLIGSFVRWLVDPIVSPSDVDLLLPDDGALVARIVGWLETQSFQVTRWGEAVTASTASIAMDRAKYFRAERLDNKGSRVVVDIGFSPSAGFYSQKAASAQYINGVLCVPEEVDLG